MFNKITVLTIQFAMITQALAMSSGKLSETAEFSVTKQNVQEDIRISEAVTLKPTMKFSKIKFTDDEIFLIDAKGAQQPISLTKDIYFVAGEPNSSEYSSYGIEGTDLKIKLVMDEFKSHGNSETFESESCSLTEEKLVCKGYEYNVDDCDYTENIANGQFVYRCNDGSVYRKCRQMTFETQGTARYRIYSFTATLEIDKMQILRGEKVLAEYSYLVDDKTHHVSLKEYQDKYGRYNSLSRICLP